MIKKELREKYLDKRNKLGSTKNNLDEEISRQFFSSFSFVGIQTIHVYLSIKKFNEIDTSQLINELWIRNQRIVVPKIVGDELISVQIDKETKFFESKWEIPEPRNGLELMPEDIDVVIVPLLAFDLNGHRVGYGKGFYDRFLQSCRQDILRIGLNYFPAVDRIDDAKETDIKLTHCVTPDRIYEF